MKNIANVLVLGAGAWGGTLGGLLAGKGCNVSLWEGSQEKYSRIKKTGVILARGPLTYKIPVSGKMKVYGGMPTAVNSAFKNGKKNLIIFAVPSHSVKDVSRNLAELTGENDNYIFLSVVKGIDTASMMTMTDVICGEIPSAGKNICVLSGPSFAVEVLGRKPTAVVAASKSSGAAKFIQEIFSTNYFRVYTSSDVRGVEIGGSLKNVFAVACGISDGLGFGDNSKAAIITRGMRELIKIGARLGGNKETFGGLSGLGDLMMTCFSNNSRNRFFGEIIGRGNKPAYALKKINSAVEGYRTSLSAFKIGREAGIELPIINEVYRILYQGKNPGEAVADLMTRESKDENK